MEKIRKKTIEKMSNLGYEYNINLPYLDPVLNTKNELEILNRINVLHILYTIGTENTIECKEFFKAKLLEKAWDVYLTESEKKILNKQKLFEKDVLNFCWKKEAMFQLLWIMQLTNDNIFKINEINVSKYMSLMPPEASWMEFKKQSKIRDVEQIIEALDYYYNINWSIKQKDKNNEMSIEESIIRERRRALEWVIYGQEWDEITLDT